MNTEEPYPFTVEQFKALTIEQRQAIEAVADYLTSEKLNAENQTDEEISSIFNLLKSCQGSVPIEEADEDILNTIRQKFGAIYVVGMELAEAELKAKKITDFNFCSIIDPSYENATHIALVDWDKPICYLHAWIKAWHMSFATLSELADEVLLVKNQLVEKVVEFSKREIFVIMEGGLVNEVINAPPNINVTVIDYDTEGAEKESFEISPLDGELCVINKW